MAYNETTMKGLDMNPKNLKNKVVRNLPTIIAVTGGVAAVTTVVLLAKSFKSIPDALVKDDTVKIDRSNINDVINMIKEAANASMIQVPEGSIIFVEN